MHASIHPFSPAYPIQCHKGAETPLGCHRARSGVDLDKTPVWCRANSTGQTTRNAHIYTYGINLESPLNTSSSQSSWRDPRPQENMQTPYRQHSAAEVSTVTSQQERLVGLNPPASCSISVLSLHACRIHPPYSKYNLPPEENNEVLTFKWWLNNV